MICVILAAGQGSRLASSAPLKPMALVCGIPLIEHVIESALTAGVTEFLVVTGYRADTLQEFLNALSRRRRCTINCIHNDNWRRANGHSVVCAEPYTDDRFLLLMADHIIDPIIPAELMARHQDSPHTVLATDSRLDNPLVDLDDVTRAMTDETGRLLKIGKGISPYNAFDSGIFLATSALPTAVREDVEQGGEGSISNAMQLLADRGQAHTHDIGDRFWIDVDDPAALARAERALWPTRRTVDFIRESADGNR